MNTDYHTLVDKYIGRSEFARGQSLLGIWFKQEWFINRIRELAIQAGRCQERMKYCKYDSLNWKKYNQVFQECQILIDNLSIDLRSI